jgi:hypothetical protein
MSSSNPHRSTALMVSTATGQLCPSSGKYHSRLCGDSWLS